MQQNQDVSLLGRISVLFATPALKWALPMLLFLAVITGVLTKPALEIQNDDDVIKFLPQDDPKIVKFKDVGDKFHGLQMAIVGVEAKGDGNLFNLEDITLIRRYATEFKTLMCHKVNDNGDWIIGEDGNPIMTQCVSNTTCFTEIQDIGHSVTEDGEETASVTDLVPEYPEPGSEEAKARAAEIQQSLEVVYAHSRTLDHVNGFLVSDDGKAAAVYAQIDDANVSAKEAADSIRDHLIKVRKEMGLEDKIDVYYSGAPFIGSYSADTARGDMMRLMPWVAVIVVGIIVLTSKSIFATLIALLSVFVSIVWVMGGMSLLGHKLTLISTSLPILLLALGSAYSIHLIAAMLSRLDEGMERKEAMKAALVHTGPPIIVCVATTAAGFFSFMAMDVDPMVEYGAAMGISTIVIMIVTFWVVSALTVLLPIKPQKGGRAPKWAIQAMKRGADFVYGHGKISLVIVCLIFVFGGSFAARVEPHGGNSSYFAEGSLPMVADDFMVDQFGGANFIQTEINADISSPLVLRQIERMTALIKSHPRIAGIQSISDIVTLVGGSMGDGQHITASYKQAKNLTALAFSNDASVAMELAMCACETPTRNGICLPECVSPKDGSCLTTCTPDMNWHHTLMQIRVRDKDLSEAASIADELQVQMAPLFSPRMAIPRDKMTPAAAVREKEELLQHLQWILKAYEFRNDPATGEPYVKTKVSDQALQSAIWETKVPLDREDARVPLNIYLFDEEEALVDLDYDKADLDAMADRTFAALQNGTYNEEWLVALVKEVVAEHELDDEEGIRAAVGFIHAQILDSSVAKLRNARAAAIFKAANVANPSEKFDELVKSAIWSLADKNVFLPRDEFPDLQQYAVDYHSDEIAESLVTALKKVEPTPQNVERVLHEEFFDVARSSYYHISGRTKGLEFVSPLNPEAFIQNVANAYSKGELTPEWLSSELHKSIKLGEEMEVIPQGYPIIYRAMNESVIHNQIVSLVYSFFMVLICLILFTMSIHTGLISVIPALMTVILTFGVMGVFGLGLDVGSSMIAAISLSVGIDYACHLIWKFGRPPKTEEACKAASDHMLETTGWGVVINALEIGLGLAVLYFGELLPMRNFGVLTGVAMIISATASLLLLSGLLRWARLHSSRQDVRLGEGQLALAAEGSATISGNDVLAPEAPSSTDEKDHQKESENTPSDEDKSDNVDLVAAIQEQKQILSEIKQKISETNDDKTE